MGEGADGQEGRNRAAASLLETHRLRLYVEQAGSGAAVLFISGTGGDLRRHPNVFDSLLPKSFAVTAYDQRGLGRSEIPPGPYDMAAYADDAAALLDALACRKCHVIGVSFGGMVAQEFALRHSDRVHGLVLCCTSAGGAAGASYPLQELAALAAEVRGPHSLALSDTRMTPDWQARHPDRVAALLDAQRAQAMIGSGEPGREAGAAWQLEARSRHDTFARLRSLSGPVLLCGGRFDGIAPAGNTEAMARELSACEVRFFDGGHLFLAQDRRAWPAIIDWLLRLD